MILEQKLWFFFSIWRAMTEWTPLIEGSQGENSILADLTTKILQMLNQTSTPLSQEFADTPIRIELDDTNHRL